MEIIDELKEQTEQEAEETPAADFGMGILLMVLSGVVCYASWFWPRPEGVSSAPGLFPFLIASTLFLMALGLLINGVRLKGPQKLQQVFTKAILQEAWGAGNLKRVALALATVLTYLIVVLNLLPFEIGTFIYVAGSLYLFWRGRIYKILLISVGMVAFYSVSFRVLFKLVLPGAGM